MLDPQKQLNAMRRHREIQSELAQIERNIREGKARLPVEEQLTRLKLHRLIENEMPELAVRCR